MDVDSVNEKCDVQLHPSADLTDKNCAPRRVPALFRGVTTFHVDPQRWVVTVENKASMRSSLIPKLVKSTCHKHSPCCDNKK